MPLAAPLGPVFLSSSSAAIVFLPVTAVCLPAPPVQSGRQVLALRRQHLVKVHHSALEPSFYTSFQCLAGV